ncbi:hypothetical protein [Parerythrobacter lacustris]|uniref:Uncharacterized protein n=1 Tax=Parerythrobacter lacustris TaxID=2969984 RepID=A0ABT1XTY7_9SPHN|nr:hypothetical protein [Parerythrobacter lacustris]MCR2834120.1 hypothetical protein [Parerythrobacter lacustris]
MIVITFKPEAEPSVASRISPQDAVALGCLMLRSCTLRETVNIEVANMALMVEGGKRSLGWFTMMRVGKPHVIARLDATSIRDLGRCIHNQYLRAIEATGDGPERSIFVRKVAYRHGVA